MFQINLIQLEDPPDKNKSGSTILQGEQHRSEPDATAMSLLQGLKKTEQNAESKENNVNSFPSFDAADIRDFPS